jgi:DnaJ-class molecular chaperone
MCVSFENCFVCNGAGHMQGDILTDCENCRGTGQLKVEDEMYYSPDFEIGESNANYFESRKI